RSHANNAARDLHRYGIRPHGGASPLGNSRPRVFQRALPRAVAVAPQPFRRVCLRSRSKNVSTVFGWTWPSPPTLGLSSSSALPVRARALLYRPSLARSCLRPVVSSSPVRLSTTAPSRLTSHHRRGVLAMYRNTTPFSRI